MLNYSKHHKILSELYPNKAIIVLDIESNGLVRDEYLNGVLKGSAATKIWCFGYTYIDETGIVNIKSSSDMQLLKELFEDSNNVIVCHNVYDYDKRLVEKLLGVNVNATLVDTLFICYYLYKNLQTPGLAFWGRVFKSDKTLVEDDQWKGVFREDYSSEQEFLKAQQEHLDLMKERVERDVEINVRLFLEKQLTYLYRIYEGDLKYVRKCINYLCFKATVLSKQSDWQIRVWLDKVREGINHLSRIQRKSLVNLAKAMPENVKYKTQNIPKVLYKKSGELSSHGVKWFNLLKEKGLPEDTQSLQVIKCTEDPNPQSPDQVKSWLFSLGWEPQNFEEGKNGPVPQVRIDEGGEKVLCPSVLRLAEIEPAILDLRDLGVLKHRIGALKSFLKYCSPEGYTSCTGKLTKTLRLTHRAPLANLVRVSETEGTPHFSDGYWIRRCIVAKKTQGLLCGSDISSLESKMKAHYTYDISPEYALSMDDPEYDAHLTLGVASTIITQEQADKHKSGECKITDIRNLLKTCNYALQYGAGVKKIAAGLDKYAHLAQKVKDGYWEVNWPVKEASSQADVVKVDTFDYGLGKRETKKWLLNPINGLRYILTSDKDVFSSWCQSGGAYVFDMWMYFVIKNGLQPFHQYHDEILIEDDTKSQKEIENILKKSMEQVNQKLKTKVTISIDVQFGKNYAEVH